MIYNWGVSIASLRGDGKSWNMSTEYTLSRYVPRLKIWSRRIGTPKTRTTFFFGFAAVTVPICCCVQPLRKFWSLALPLTRPLTPLIRPLTAPEMRLDIVGGCEMEGGV